MKKFLSIAMILAMTLTMLAGCSGKQPTETTVPTTAGAEEPGSALEILETVWGLYTEDEKFPATGGTMGQTLTQGPGAYTTLDETLTYTLLIPADQLGNVTDVASLMHMMNSNTFTCGAYRLGPGVTAESFGAAMKEAVLNNQWICGFPDKLLIESIGDSFLVVAFGHEEIMDTFKTHLEEAYPGRVLAEEPII